MNPFVFEANFLTPKRVQVKFYYSIKPFRVWKTVPYEKRGVLQEVSVAYSSRYGDRHLIFGVSGQKFKLVDLVAGHWHGYDLFTENQYARGVFLDHTLQQEELFWANHWQVDIYGEHELDGYTSLYATEFKNYISVRNEYDLEVFGNKLKVYSGAGGFGVFAGNREIKPRNGMFVFSGKNISVAEAACLAFYGDENRRYFEPQIRQSISYKSLTPYTVYWLDKNIAQQQVTLEDMPRVIFDEVKEVIDTGKYSEEEVFNYFRELGYDIDKVKYRRIAGRIRV